MLPKSNTEWKMWGKIDPLWAVSAWKDKQKGGKSPWSDEEFYELGRRDWNDFIAHWERYGVNKEAVLEIGCGTGRLTAQMAHYFGEVVAIDVSEEMIIYAKRRIPSENVTFHIVDGCSIPLPQASVTAVFSTHVFQHLESLDDATTYFNEIHRVLREGGSMMIHLPILAWPASTPTWVRIPYLTRRAFGKLKRALWRSAISRGQFRPLMVMSAFPIEFLYSSLEECGFTDIEIHIFVTTSNNDPHPCVLARKGT